MIPSKYRVEEELQRRRNGATRAKSFSDGIHELSNSTRRSFFKRKRGATGESKELAVYSDVASLLSHTDSEKLKMKQSHSYLRVEKRNYQNKRPVLIVGPFSEAIGDKLASDYPATFGHCEPEYLNSDLATVEQGIADNVFVDFKRRGPHFECTTLKSVRDVMGEGKHCLLDVHMSAVERLHQVGKTERFLCTDTNAQVQIYPIVLLVKYKTVKQLREVRDPRYLPESLSQKDARHLQVLIDKSIFA